MDNSYFLRLATDDEPRSPTARRSIQRRTTWHPQRLSSTILSALFLALVATTPALAARIPFQNCLPDSYRLNDPTPLQWVPLYADAVFDTVDDSHELQVVVWGNVTGSRNNAALPAANDSYWEDDSETNGKIIQTENPGAQGSKATTLARKIDVLTFEPWSNRVDFCASGLTNASCPLSPVFSVDGIEIPYGLPSINISHSMLSSYSFTSFSATFLVIYGDKAATNIGCVSATITPDLGDLAWVLKFLPLLVLLFTGFAVTFASIFSPWGTADVFHWTSNYGRDADLLRLVTPGFGDCLQYIQFIALTGGLTLSYPGFFQPIVSQVGWSALMFNESLVADAPGWQSVVDGIYITNGSYGMHEMGQLIGMAEGEDIWAGMMVWLCVAIVSVVVLVQIGFLAQWLYRRINKTSEEDLRAKNIPFVIGNVVRIVFNYFLLPVVALSSFQLVIASDSPPYTVGLAATTLVLLIVFAAWLLYLIITTRPKSVLFDDLPTVLRYGPLYNTYSDEAAAFALIPVLLTLIRGIAIGAVQPSGIAQVVLLAICEVIQILTLHAFRPFHSPTSMNAYHTIFSALRLITILLMVAFTPTLGVTDGPKGWIGYAILVIHAAVLVLGFFLNACQRIIEVVARMLGAGGDDQRGLTRGGLSKIFGMRQLSRRVTHRSGPSRASQLSTSAMLDAEEGTKTGYSMPGGRLRSESAGSLGGMAVHHRQRSSSVLDSIDVYSGAHRNVDSGSSYMPGTPGETSTFSFLPSPIVTRAPTGGISMEASDPYYRPPRRRRETLNESLHSDMQRHSLSVDPIRASQAGLPIADIADMGAEISRVPTPAPPGTGSMAMNFSPQRPDYSTREVDFYYGVRGPALNSDAPGRRLGTGPADPTGPVATATGWFRNIFGGTSKEKGKGFEVVRSARMPPGMMRNGGFGDETPPEGIPVAMGVLRNGPIDSDDEDEPAAQTSPRHQKGDLLTDNGDPQDDPESPVEERKPNPFGAIRTQKGDASDGVEEDLPIPRKSSKRHSATINHAHSPSLHPVESHSSSSNEPGPSSSAAPVLSRLPFERTSSDKRLSSKSSLEFPNEFVHVSLEDAREDRPASYGTVRQHGINWVDPALGEADLLGREAEVVDDRSGKQGARR